VLAEQRVQAGALVGSAGGSDGGGMDELARAVGALEARWAGRLREMDVSNSALRRRAEWAEGILQLHVQAAAAVEAAPAIVEEGEAPAPGDTPPVTGPEELSLGSRQAAVEGGAGGAGAGAADAGAGAGAGAERPLGRRRVCPVCMDSPRDGAMVPCGHTACVRCAVQLQLHRGSCAECNATIETVLTLFGV
jgi:hypothetical protein